MHREILQESAIMKFTSRQRNLELKKTEETISKNTVIVSLLADLQQEQDKESEILLALLPDKVLVISTSIFNCKRPLILFPPPEDWRSYSLNDCECPTLREKYYQHYVITRNINTRYDCCVVTVSVTVFISGCANTVVRRHSIFPSLIL